MTKKLVLEGKIVCIYHDHTGKMGSHLLNPEDTPCSVVDIKVGRLEMSVIRPMTKKFEWRGKGEVKSGDKIRITLEVLK